MTTVTYGPGVSLRNWIIGDTAAVIQQDLQNLGYIVPDLETPTEAIGDYRLLNDPAKQTIFYGSGFTYTSTGYPRGGIITGLEDVYQGQIVFAISDTSVPVATVESWVNGGLWANAAATLFGGNDTFYAPTGTATFDGYNGISTVVVPDAVRQNSLTSNPNTPSNAVLTGPTLNYTLSNIDRLQFIDGTTYYDGGSPAAQVVRLYQAALGRAPDPIGLSAWVGALNNGASLTQLVQAFLSSAEFQARFSGATGSATAFVTQLYANVLHRAPDAAGLSAWVNVLQSGSQSQAQVLAGFSESTENQNNTANLVSNGIWVANEQAASVARLYYATLNRAPDANGLVSWTTALQNGSLTLEQEAGDFMASSEFQQKYGTLSNSDFVTLLYENVLNRQPESAGLAAWTNALASGTTRADVVLGFSQSTEFQTNMLPKIEAGGIILA
jgi:hypothetical protein